MLEDVREHPATWTLAAAWVLLFLAMQGVMSYVRAHERDPLHRLRSAAIGPGALSIEVTHLFGDLSYREIREGHVWRALTATFIHYSFFHLLMNVFGLIQLGRLIEPWYGSGPFLFLCLILGLLGNLFGSLARFLLVLLRQSVEATSFWRSLPKPVVDWFGPLSSADVHAAGGSTILLGLMGIALVVGVRSRTRIGSYLADQMWTLLGFTALLGLVMPGVVDNFGHGGGALAGILLGFAHRPLIRKAERPRWVWGGWVASVVLISVAYAALSTQSVAEIRERQKRFDAEQATGRLREINDAVMLLDALGPVYQSITDQAFGSITVDAGELSKLRDGVLPGPPPPPADGQDTRPIPPNPPPAVPPQRPTMDPGTFQAVDLLDARLKRLNLDPEAAEAVGRLIAGTRKAFRSDLTYPDAYELRSDYLEVRRAVRRLRESADAGLRQPAPPAPVSPR